MLVELVVLRKVHPLRQPLHCQVDIRADVHGSVRRWKIMVATNQHSIMGIIIGK